MSKSKKSKVIYRKGQKGILKKNEENTISADVYQGQSNLTGDYPTGSPLLMYTGEDNYPDLKSKKLETIKIDTPNLDFNRKIEVKGPGEKEYEPEIDYYGLSNFGLSGISNILNYNQDLNNRQQLYTSIQNRDSKPLYDYNYMYGRTTSGGTEYQPVIKAEMGANIKPRYNTPYAANNVEIEGGEYIQLPDMSGEIAYGPSHSEGGIQTILPGDTRVYSNYLKPEGSKKTFAQLAKKYDNTEYDKILNNKFSKKVDKETASIMKDRNQRQLDQLFADQQKMNGNSNGEIEAKYGASINNPGFKSLPKYVQDKILQNMEYGGYNLPELQNGDWYTEEQWDAALRNQNQNQSTNQRPTKSSNRIQSGPYPDNNVISNFNNKAIPTYTEDELNLIRGYDESFNPDLGTVPGMQRTVDKVYGSLSNIDIFNKNYDWYLPQFEKQYGRSFNPKSKEDVGLAQKAYQEEMTNRFIKAGYTPEEAAKVLNDVGFVNEQSLPNSFDQKLGYYTATRKLFNPKQKQVSSNQPKKEEPQKEEVVQTPDTKFDPATGVKPNPYKRMPFPIEQVVPNMYGLAQAQEVFPYAIPELDSQYIRPQTLNIQSELQDIDNMGQAAIRSGADPLAVYIAGMDSKQKAFQTKQNFDAQGRSQADIFNAQADMQTDNFNAQMFDRVYNNQIANARDAQSYEKHAALQNLVDKYSKYEADERMKEVGMPIVASSMKFNQDTGMLEVDPKMIQGFNFDYIQNALANQTTEDKSKTQKSKSKTTRK